MSSAVKLPREVVIYTDGASRGNPGPASIGVVIADKAGEVLLEISKRLGNQTNNYAEYMALVEGLLAAAEGGAKAVTVKADSQLMVRQMLGEYKVKAEGIIPLFQQCQKLVTLFEKIHFVHIPREENAEADRLANRALDGR